MARFAVGLVSLCLLISSVVLAQDDHDQAVGLPLNATFSGSNFDSVQLNNGNLHVEIPLFSLPGRGVPTTVKLVYDSKGWYGKSIQPPPDGTVDMYPRGQPGGNPPTSGNNMGWTVAAPLTIWTPAGGNGLLVSASGKTQDCGSGHTATISTYTYREPNGTQHGFPPVSAPGNQCGLWTANSLLAVDGSGYTLKITWGSSNPFDVYTKEGTHLYNTVDQSGAVTGSGMEDTNGNKITRSVTSGVPASTLTDTLGRSINAAWTLNAQTGNYELKYYDSNNQQQTIVFIMTTVNVNTNLCGYQIVGDGGCNEWVGGWQAPHIIQLPNGMAYTINYVQAGVDPSPDGQISSIQLPTGATISYTWGVPPAQWDLDHAGPRVKSRTIVSNGQTSTWKYTYSEVPLQSATTTVNEPDDNNPNGNDVVHNFDFSGCGSRLDATYDIRDQYFKGLVANNVILKTVETEYQDITEGPQLPTSVNTTWNNQGGLKSRVETDYDAGPQVPNGCPMVSGWGNVKEKREYGFGTGGNYGSLVRRTDYDYAHISGDTGYNVNYVNLGISDLLTEKTVCCDAQSHNVSDSVMVYDDYGNNGLISTANTPAPNHDYTGIGTYRGNVTKSSAWRNLPTPASWIDTLHTYDDLGNVRSTTDPLQHITSFKYDDSWSGTGCGLTSGSHTFAFLTETDAPDTVNQQGATVHHQSQTTYYPCTGQKQSVRDENDILALRSGTTYTYDSMLRRVDVTDTAPNGGHTHYAYGDPPAAISVTKTEMQDSTHNIVTTSYVDGLGRVKQTKLVDPDDAVPNDDGAIYVDTTYDLNGRVASVSNPHRSVALATDGVTQYRYDPLGRKTLEVPPDGTSSSNNVTTVYTGTSVGLITTVTDQAGNQRRSYVDALGRLVEVDEPAIDGVQPAIAATGSVTFTGTEKNVVIPPQPGTPGKGTVAINGNLQSINPCEPDNCRLYDMGSVTITVNQHSDPATYNDPRRSPCQYTCGAGPVATALANAINNDSGAYVTATVDDLDVLLTATTTGQNTNYSLDASKTWDTRFFANPSFTPVPSGPTLTGGTDAQPQQTIWDEGELSIKVDQVEKTTNYDHDAPNDYDLTHLAANLAAAFAADGGSCVTATSSGPTVNFTARVAGAAGNNCSIVPTTKTNLPLYFSSPSFTVSSTVSMNGGQDPVQPIDRPAVTIYGYDLLDNLLTATQKGYSNNNYRSRTFTYDSLSRLLTAANPESGTTTWTYNDDSNAVTKKDARNITITYNYDQLHRVATVGATHAKSYSNSDPAVDYYFDQTSYNGLTITEGVNQRTGMNDRTGATAWTFDAEGRPLQEKHTINISGLTPSAVTETFAYAYNPDDSLQSLTYPSGHRIGYTYSTPGNTNTTGWLRQALDTTNLSAIKYYVTAASYTPHGELAAYINGQNSTIGITTTDTWNNRLQPTSFLAATQGSGAHSVLSLSFNFNQGTPAAPINNGMLVKITNAINSGRTTNYSYDAVNRIRAAWHDATDWGTKYTIDSWGNLTQKGQCDNIVCPTRNASDTFNAAANTNNQFTGYSYDSDGNLLNDQLGHTYSYDAEDRPYSAGGVTYYYDGEGERVAKSSGKLYWFGTNSAPILETDVNGNTTEEYVFFNGKRTAMRDAGTLGAIHYYFADQVGSANIVTNVSGDMPPQQDIEYHPYGEQQVYTDTLGQKYRFTAHEHDTDTNNDYFGARYYSSSFGRFMSPDWAATPTPVPNAAIENPQTLNLYSYVENNPITGTDPDGHCAEDLCIGEYLAVSALITYTASPAGQQAISNGVQALFHMTSAVGNAIGNLFQSSNNSSKTAPGTPATPAPTIAPPPATSPTIPAPTTTPTSGQQVPAQAPGFVGDAGGNVVQIPVGSTARPANNGNGIVYQPPVPAGAPPNANAVRVMGPTAAQPTGSITVHNPSGQPINPATGKPDTRANTHTPIVPVAPNPCASGGSGCSK